MIILDAVVKYQTHSTVINQEYETLLEFVQQQNGDSYINQWDANNICYKFFSNLPLQIKMNDIYSTIKITKFHN